MGDINQEWKELRMKNGNFINHIDGELAKIEKEKRLLNEQKEQIFYDPVTCMYFKADAEGIQKLLDKQSEYVANEIDKLKQDHWDEMEQLQNANSKLEHDNFQLKQALDTSAKDADANFERGQHKGQEELWGVLQDVSEAASMGFDLEHVYGYNNMSDVVANLTASAFLRKTEEYEKQAKDIQLGDEVEIFDEFDHDLSDIGIVIAMDKDNPCFAVIGPNFEGCFDTTDIQFGTVKKTGQHYDAIPLDYLA